VVPAGGTSSVTGGAGGVTIAGGNGSATVRFAR
jgi:hypothetical protein